MHKKLKQAKASVSTHKIALIGVIVAIAISEIIVIVSDLLLCGEIGILNVIRGFIIPLVVSTVMAAVTVPFVNRLRYAETALRESEAENQALLTTLPDLMLQFSSDGHFLHYHAASPEVLWLPQKDFLGKSIYDVLPESSAEGLMTHITNAVDSQKVQRFEYQLPYENAPHYYEARIVPMNGDRVLAIIRDITMQKETEKALVIERTSLAERVEERTAALREANVQLVHALQARNDFMSNVSHELRTPLTAILAFSDLVQRQLYGPLTERQATAMSNIKGSAQHLLELINNILNLSEIEAGTLALNIDTVDVNNVCQSCLDNIKAAAQKKGLNVEHMLDDSVVSIQADALRLEQILLNLLNNAIKFTPNNGKIGLEMRGDTETSTVHFTVWDTGIGIAQDDFTRIFKPFIQLDSSLTREYGGSGLGLALVESLVEMHGGAITVKSEIGKGSHFTISLPWRKPNPNKNTKTATGVTSATTINTAPCPDKTIRVLVAEDNQYNQMALCELLRTEGFCTSAAQDGAEAIRIARERHPHVILMDIQMPGMDGLDTTRRIRADAELKHTHIIAVTALAMPGDKERCLAAGADRYLSKPIDSNKLLEMIEELTADVNTNGA